MITDFNEHAANERTFLAWVRTGIAVAAFGFVVEKFNLFLFGLARSELPAPGYQGLARRLGSPVGHIEGLALIFGGVGLIALSTVRFVRLTRRLDDAARHAAQSIRAELVLSAALVTLIGGYSLYLALG
jgi:putative membrane protein